jgi:hypothetical protein
MHSNLYAGLCLVTAALAASGPWNNAGNIYAYDATCRSYYNYCGWAIKGKLWRDIRVIL